MEKFQNVLFFWIVEWKGKEETLFTQRLPSSKSKCSKLKQEGL